MTCLNWLLKVWPQTLTSSFLDLPPQGCIALTTVHLGSVWLYYHICGLWLPPGSSCHSFIRSFLIPLRSSPTPVLAQCWLCVKRCWTGCTVQPSGRGAERAAEAQKGSQWVRWAALGGVLSQDPGAGGQAWASGMDKGRPGENWHVLGWRGTVVWDPELERGCQNQT